MQKRCHLTPFCYSNSFSVSKTTFPVGGAILSVWYFFEISLI